MPFYYASGLSVEDKGGIGAPELESVKKFEI